MNPWIACLLFAMAAAAIAYHRRRTEPAAATRSAASQRVPRRIVNPAGAGRPEVKVWLLHAGTACRLTRMQLHGHRFATEEAIALPLRGCRSGACDCRYEPAVDRRRIARRATADRRELLRFEMSGDRRLGRDRRRDSAWSQPHLY